MAYRLVITGGRNIKSRARVWNFLETVVCFRGRPLGLISGGAVGVDTLAEEWAEFYQIPVYQIPYARGRELGGPPAQWGKNRNIIMLKMAQAKGDCVLVAIWDGMSGGTAHCIATGAYMGIPLEYSVGP